MPQRQVAFHGDLERCGVQKLIYLVEADPNSLEAAESIKTACFTTEIWEGFDVQRISGFSDTVRRYGYLTKSIMQYYDEQLCICKVRHSRGCSSYEEFISKCQGLEKMTVPQVTEEIALVVVGLYPTVLSLAQAYSQPEGDLHVQEEMLKNKSKVVSSLASRNIFKLVWGVANTTVLIIKSRRGLLASIPLTGEFWCHYREV